MEGTISEIRAWGPNWAPRNWFLCQGQLLPIASYTAFFSLIGTIYGGDGRTTFQLPDLRGRMPIGSGSGPGLSNYPIGSKGGIEHVTLSQLEMPSHSHQGAAVSASGSVPVGGTATINADTSGASSDPTNRFLAQDTNANIYGNRPDTTLNSASVTLNGSIDASAIPPPTINIGNAGGSQAHENRQPFQTCNYIICFQGIFPSRS